MSAFLGKIHYWLFNKIQLHETLIKDIIKAAEIKGFDGGVLLSESYSKYGTPVTGELEDEIEHGNIHGWLQERIISVESRLAYIATELLKEDIVKKEEISEVFYENAVSIMNELEINEGTPKQMFLMIFDYMLEGMPCDRINEVAENTENIIQWNTLSDIHKNYWNNVGGDVNNFYSFRDAWINGFLSASNLCYKYTRTENGVNTIVKG